VGADAATPVTVAASLSDPVIITLAFAAFFLLLALLTFLRIVMRKAPPTWRRYRIGVFVERDPDDRPRD
jgi:hypothetical protein